MISRVVSFLLLVAFSVALHVIHEYVLCGIFSVFAALHLIPLGALIADPKVFD